MNTKRNPTILALGVALALAAGSASATNGYYTHGTGTKSKAQAGAGSANPEEILVLATNPAGIAYVPESIDAGLGIFSPMRSYRTTDSLANGGCSPTRLRKHHRPERPAERERVLPDPARRDELGAERRRTSSRPPSTPAAA